LKEQVTVLCAHLWSGYPPVLPGAKLTYLLYNLTDCGVCFLHITMIVNKIKIRSYFIQLLFIKNEKVKGNILLRLRTE